MNPRIERLGVGTEHLREGSQGRVDLGVAVVGRANDRGVETERHVVDEHVTVHVGEVEPSLHRVAIRVERPDDVVAVEPEIEREVVPCAGGDDHHRQPELSGDAADHGLRAVTARHAEHVDAARGHVAHALEPVLIRLEHDRFDPAAAAFVDKVEPLRLTAARLEVHEQHAALRGRDGSADDIRGLEGSHIRAERILRERHRGHQREDPCGDRGAEPAFGVDDGGREADGGRDGADHRHLPALSGSRQGDPHRRQEHGQQDEPRYHPDRFVRADRERGDDDPDDEQDRHDRGHPAASRRSSPPHRTEA